ncbi:MAG: hypothetical protein HY791_24285 [Deltaproteobacteria bacterium]|nr:hypothetical protein [Deltaproteobacteria bacterium]
MRTALGSTASPALLLFACAEPFVAIPMLPEGTRALVVSTVADGRRAWTATEPSGSVHAVAEEISVAAYDQSPSELGLHEGVFFPAPDGSCALLWPSVVYGGTPSEGLRQIDGDDLTEALVPNAERRCSECPFFTEDPVPYGPFAASVSIAFAVPLPDGRALVGGRSYGTFAVSTEASTPVAGCDLYTAAAPAPDGRLWLAGTSTRTFVDLVEVRDDRCEVLESIPVADALDEVRFVETDPADAEQVAASTKLGKLFRRAGSRFELILDIPRQSLFDDGGLVATGPGELAFSPGSSEVVFVGRGRPLTYRATQYSSVSALGYWPGVGVVAGDLQGDLFLFDDGTFEPLRTLTRAFVGAILPYRDGIIATAANGLYFVPKSRVECEDQTLGNTSSGAPLNGFVVGDTIFLGDARERAIPTGVWLIPDR